MANSSTHAACDEPSSRRQNAIRFLVATLLLCVLSTSLLGQEASLTGQDADLPSQETESLGEETSPFVIVLGIAQDGGFPQAGCDKSCCQKATVRPSLRSGPTCLAIIDPASQERWLVECTPDFPNQLARLNQAYPARNAKARATGAGLNGILLTHAHIGHYAGLIHLGREVVGARSMPVHCMPRMRGFLASNGPWDQLVDLENIRLVPMTANVTFDLNENISVTPIAVPHRDEYSETVGFQIQGPNHSVLFLPDIDKWERWQRAVEDIVSRVDVAYLDATFYDTRELPGRNLDEIPHPFVVETMRRFEKQPASMRAKIRLIHLNHSNPALDSNSEAAESIRNFGMRIASIGERVDL